MDEDTLKKLKSKYLEKINKEINKEMKKDNKNNPTLINPASSSKPVLSHYYEEFKKEYFPLHLTLYEKLCNYSEKFFKVEVHDKKKKSLQEALNMCHLSVTPEGASSLALIGSLITLVIIVGLGIIVPFLTSGNLELFTILAGGIIAIITYFFLERYPFILANSWKIKASSQMVLTTFYLSTYMRHSPNLESALRFAAEHLTPPMSLDFRRILWEVESNKYQSVKEALEKYMELWKKDAPEFVEALQLIISSLYETSEDRRLNSLDKAIDIILEEMYDKMLHYSHSLKGPVTMIHMLGIVLPVLGLVILPLVVSFMEGTKWYHISFIYNILLPIGVYFLTKNVLSNRPSGYGGKSIEELAPFLKTKINNMRGLSNALSIFIPLFLIGISPLLIHLFAPNFDIRILYQEVEDEVRIGGLSLLGYNSNGVGPFGVGATLLSIFITMAIGLSIGVYYKTVSEKPLKVRENVKRLEKEFAGTLFQLANKLGDGLPIEIALSKMAEELKHTKSGEFFSAIYTNMTKMGYSLEKAIFDKEIGAIRIFPSPLVDSSMKILVDSIKKGPLVCSKALINISTYLRNMDRIEERLRDLMADELSNMKTQVGFLTPIISGIVIGITSMISTIFVSLQENINLLQSAGSNLKGTNFGNIAQIMNMFNMTIPTFYFQVIIGVYLIEVIFLLVNLINSLENGEDELSRKGLLGKYMITSTLLYSIIAFVIIIIFNLLAASITGSGVIM